MSDGALIKGNKGCSRWLDLPPRFGLLISESANEAPLLTQLGVLMHNWYAYSSRIKAYSHAVQCASAKRRCALIDKTAPTPRTLLSTTP
eukprot:3716525-Pleurochrysis_carterae.AAC.2